MSAAPRRTPSLHLSPSVPALLEFYSAIGDLSDETLIPARAAALLREIARADRVEVFALDTVRHHLVRLAAAGLGSDGPLTLPLADYPLLAEVVASLRPRRILGGWSPFQLTGQSWPPPGVRSVFCAPLVARGEVLGVVCVQWTASLLPSVLSLQFLETLIQFVAVALLNARLHAEVERRARRLDALNRAAAALATLELDQALPQVAAGARQCTGAAVALVWLLDPHTSSLTLAARADAQATVAPPTPAPVVPVEAAPVLREILENGHSTVVAASTLPLGLDQPAGLATALAVPLIGRRGPLGVLVLGFATEPPDQALVVLAEAYANQAALAIENARLHHDLKQALEARGRFVAIATHELRTPLAVLKGNIQIALRLVGDSPLRPMLEVIGVQVARLEYLVRDLADIIRLESGRFSLRMVPFDLARWVQERTQRLAVLAPQHQLVVEAVGPLNVQADPERLESVLANLLSNAFRHAPPGSTVVVRAERQGTEAVLSVADQGPGIPPELQTQVFEPFFRATDDPGGRPAGLGLGLYIAREIIEAHGGRIWVVSQPGQGATFFVALPLTGSAGEVS